MDPNANLKEQLELASKLVEANNTEDAARLAELVIALSKWLCNGGFLPEQWGPHTNNFWKLVPNTHE